jgi:UDP-N-acetylmuramoyl-L-alanyl-D-glutamate--2,6-diaminopimelate ligase
MELREVLAGMQAEIEGDDRAEVADLAYDSRAAGSGTLFFCLVGARADGHDYAPQVVEAGAAALVVERPLGLGVPEALVASARDAMAPAAVRFYGDPTAELAVAGITGTNGKTTSAFLLRHILETASVPTGLLGTVKSVVGGSEAALERTTPESIDLQALFRSMLDAGDAACAMEVSSHALAIGRTAGVRFAVAAFTNLTQDHLDFHADMEEYFAAKRLLFEPPPGAPAPPPAAAVVNVDDAYGRRLADAIASDYDDRLVTVSAAGDTAATLAALDVGYDAAGSRFRLATPDGEHSVALPIPGLFNVENALTAIGCAWRLGVPLDVAANALGNAGRVPGRLEPVVEGQAFAVLVDYAHTPDSLENVLEAARRITPGRVICVFGCGGDRDRDKRPQMGAIAARLADVSVVTSDNPRSERPEAILGDILAGMPEPGESLLVEVDRRLAIRAALALADPGDSVVVAGKGHEQGQELEGGRKVPFDDREVAREELRRLLAAPAPAS